MKGLKGKLPFLLFLAVFLLSGFATVRAEANCTDSDNGMDYYISGIVTSNSSTRTDTCKDSELREGYCDASSSTGIGVISYKCPYGCKDGACLNATANITCTDSDNGFDLLVAGTCTSLKGTFTDMCWSDNIVTEYRCENSECIAGGAAEGNCPEGHVCSKGACVDLSTSPDCQYFKKLYMSNAKDVDGKLVIEYVSNNVANIEVKLQKVYSAYGIYEEEETSCAIVSKECTDESGAVKLATGSTKYMQCTIVTNCNYPTLEGYSSEYQYYATVTDRDCTKVSDKKYLSPTYNYCEDYDRGLNFYIRSQVYTYTGPTFYDCCVDTEGGACKRAAALLTETYCEDKKPKNYTYTCQNGCKDGVCVVAEGEKPDLIIENISLEYSSNKSGFPAYVYTVYVKNIGNAPASMSYMRTTVNPPQPRRIEEHTRKKKGEEEPDYWMHSSGYTGIPNYNLVSGEILPPGWSERFSEYFNPSEDGEVTISAEADAEEDVVESNEANNKLEKTFAVTKVFDIPATPVPEPCPGCGECPIGGCVGPAAFNIDLSPPFYQTSTGKWETFSLKIKDSHKSGSYTYKIFVESSGGYSAYDMPLALLPFFMSSFASSSLSPITGRLISSVVSSQTLEKIVESSYMTATPAIAIPSTPTTTPPVIPPATTPSLFSSTSALKFEYNNETEIESGTEKTVEIKVMADREGIHSFTVRVSTGNGSNTESRTATTGVFVKKQAGYCGTGCTYNFYCIPFGSRMITEGTNVYCSITTGQMETQKETDVECQNDYECLSNACMEGRCRKMYSILEQVWGWLKSMFGMK